MEFGKALTYPFEDEKWLSKLGVAVAVSLYQGIIPYFGLAPLYGWQLRLIANVKRGEETPLPSWDDFDAFILKGLLALVANLIYLLPIVLFVGVALLVQFGGLATASAASDRAAVAATLGIIVLACCGCLASLYGLVGVAAFWAGLMRYAESGTFRTFVEFGTNFSLVFNNIGPFSVAMLYATLGGVIFLLGSVITLGLGLILAPVAFCYFRSHILGQLARQLEESGTLVPAEG